MPLPEADHDDHRGYHSILLRRQRAGVHDVIGSRCDPYTRNLMAGEDVNTCCHSNLVRAAVGDGLEESDVQDVLSVFMCTGYTRDTNQYFAKPSLVEVGDYTEFLAEIDLMVSALTCPQSLFPPLAALLSVCVCVCVSRSPRSRCRAAME